MPRKPKSQPAIEPVDEASETSLVHDTTTNQPPAEEALSMVLDDIELEAKNWCDGEPLSSQEQADKLTALIDAAVKLDAEIEITRATEKKPYLEAGRAVDAKFKPLAERAGKTIRVMKNAVGEWLKLVRAENERKAQEARREAEEAEKRLREEHEAARKSADFANASIDDAEERAKDAKRAAAEAARQTATAAGGDTRVSLRKEWIVNIVEARELLQFYLRNRPEFREDLKNFLYAQARKDVRAGARSLPGCSIWSEDKAV